RSVSSLPPDPDAPNTGPHRAAEYRAVAARWATGAQGHRRRGGRARAQGRHYALKTAPRRRRCGSSRPRELEVLRGLQHPNIVQLWTGSTPSLRTTWCSSWVRCLSGLQTGLRGMLTEFGSHGRGSSSSAWSGRGPATPRSDAAAIAATLFGADKTVMSEMLLVDFRSRQGRRFQKEEEWRVGDALTNQAPGGKPYLGKPADVYSLGRGTFHRSFEKGVSPEAKDFISRLFEDGPGAERGMTAVTAPAPDSDPSVVGNVPEGAAPAAGSGGRPETPADKAHPVAVVIEDGGARGADSRGGRRRGSQGGGACCTSTLPTPPPSARRTTGSPGSRARSWTLDRRTEAELPRASALTLRKSSNMVFRGAEVGVLGFADSMRACVCSPVDEQVNLAPQVKANGATLPR
ncbi:hypothetical protein DFJ74DRAFT_698175, partial [Hyaloraphidium curvatum]